MDMGAILTRARKQHGYNRKQFAELLDIPYRTLQNYENNSREPPVNFLVRFAQALNVSLDDLFDNPYKQINLTETALRIARQYQSLDVYGQEAVRGVISAEVRRQEDERAAVYELEPEAEEAPRAIRDYTFGPAAGPLVGMSETDYDLYTLQPGDPEDADYTTTVRGDSMEPYFPDGSRVFVKEHEKPRDGEVGIFEIDGMTVIKQIHYDDHYGVYLFSLNRNRRDMDIPLIAGTAAKGRCQGRVIPAHRFPIPGIDFEDKPL